LARKALEAYLPLRVTWACHVPSFVLTVYGNGPAYRKHGQRVLYSLDDLTAWSDASRRSSTSEVPDV